MSAQVGKNPGKRSKPSYIYSIISITLVLFMLGMLGIVLLFSNNISTYLKENIEVSIYLKETLSPAEISLFHKKIDRAPYIKQSEYISKEDAAKIMKEEMGDDMSLLNANPLPPSINFHLKANYVHPDSLANIKDALMAEEEVFDVYYAEALVDVIHNNIKKISFVLLGIALLLIIIALTLIDSTIKLAMYSNRFLIRSMQLVGATRWFIIRPFILRGIFNGFASGLLAVLALVGLLYYIQSKIPNIINLKDLVNFGIVFIAVISIGVIISWASTQRSVAKYLRMKLDDLY